MSKANAIYVPQEITPWENLKVGIPALGDLVPVKPIEGMGFGFLPVYRSREEAVKDYPEQRIEMYILEDTKQNESEKQ